MFHAIDENFGYAIYVRTKNAFSQNMKPNGGIGNKLGNSDEGLNQSVGYDSHDQELNPMFLMKQSINNKAKETQFNQNGESVPSYEGKT